jgi:hypothetical protein
MNRSIRDTRAQLVVATKALANYQWKRKGDSKEAVCRRVAILAAWLHIMLHVAGITKTTPATKHYTLAALDSALLSNQAS